MKLEEANSAFSPPSDRRPKLAEPPPVRLLAVDDARLPAPAGVEVQLDAFYLGLLCFERDPGSDFPVYRAENFRLHFDVREPPIQRQDTRALGIVVSSLAALEEKLIDAELEHVRQRGLAPGQETIALLDPAGNWIEITESRDLS